MTGDFVLDFYLGWEKVGALTRMASSIIMIVNLSSHLVPVYVFYGNDESILSFWALEEQGIFSL